MLILSRTWRSYKDVMLRVIALLFALSASATAQTPVLSAPGAAAQMEAGAILLDIRSEAEWKETGLAKGAWPVSMHDPGFAQTLQSILARHAPDTIALICATGGRTEYVTGILQKNGINGVADVSEGMMGNARGPGWIARGLPVVSLAEAQSAFEAAFSQK